MTATSTNALVRQITQRGDSKTDTDHSLSGNRRRV